MTPNNTNPSNPREEELGNEVGEVLESMWPTVKGWNNAKQAIMAAFDRYIAAREATMQAEWEANTINNIHSIANDLATKDPKAIGSVSIGPYMLNAITIYQEYLKGDNYERIDWRSLNLPTLNRLAAQTNGEGK